MVTQTFKTKIFIKSLSRWMETEIERLQDQVNIVRNLNNLIACAEYLPMLKKEELLAYEIVVILNGAGLDGALYWADDPYSETEKEMEDAIDG